MSKELTREEYLLIKAELANVLKERVWSVLRTDRDLNQNNADDKVLRLLVPVGCRKFDGGWFVLKMVEKKHRVKAGRSPYDILAVGEINGKPFRFYLNNKVGNMKGGRKNDTTTYNNLFKVYMNAKGKVLKTSDAESLVIEGNCYYAIYVMDQKHSSTNFFTINELEDGELYVNFSNKKCQVSYNPKIAERVLQGREFATWIVEKTDRAMQKGIRSLREQRRAAAEVLRNVPSLPLEIRPA